MQQCFGDPCLEMTEHDVFNLLARQPDFAAQDSEQEHAKVCPAFEHPQEISAVYHQELAVGHRGRVSTALITVEHRDFAKDVAGVEDRENDLFPAVGK